MAVMLRTVSSLGRLTCSSSAATRVRCEFPKPDASFVKHQETSSWKSKNTADISQSADLPACCQAGVAFCPPPTRRAVAVFMQSIQVENLSLAVEARTETIEQHAEPLPRSFLAASVNGTLVECSARGSRPLYSNVLVEFLKSFRQGEILSETDHKEVMKAFQAALANTPRDAPHDALLLSQCAMFIWKLLGDLDAAEDLCNTALEIAPNDPYIQANHALFLWQCDT